MSPNQFVDKNPKHPIAAALDMVKAGSKVKFDETVEMAMVLNVDPRKANQTVRGAVQLPKGSGKSVREGWYVSRFNSIL